MRYKIFRNNILVVEVKPLPSSVLSQKKEQEDIIRLNFVLNQFIDIQIGDYISFEKTEQIYYINKNPKVIESPANYTYECIFEGSLHELRKTKVFFQTPKASGGFYKDYKFPLTGTAQTFLEFIVSNLNRNNSGYIVGVYKDTGTYTINFNNWNVYEAIVELSKLISFNWYLDGKTLNFDSKEVTTAYVFQVGRLKGFTSLTRFRVESEDVQTVVYGYGSTENMPPRTASFGTTYDSDLLTENRLSFEGVDGESKLENNVNKYGSIESIQEFDIKPERIGAVTQIDPSNLLHIYDNTIDFDINENTIEGVSPKITFLSGKLLGLTFTFTFDYSTKKIILNPYTDESGSYPNELALAAVSDTYTLTDIVLPASYILNASESLKQTTQEYINKNSGNLELFDAVVDEAYIQASQIVLDIGDIIRIVSVPFKLDSLFEIKELTQDINNKYKYNIKFGDVLPKNLLTTLKNINFTTNQEIYNINRNAVTNNQVTNIIGDEIAWQSL